MASRRISQLQNHLNHLIRIFVFLSYKLMITIMDLKEIMAIAGKPGLYKMVAQAKNGIVVESVIDQKRFQAFTSDKVSTLEEISIYTDNGDMPLREVFRTLFKKLDGKQAPDNKGDNNKIKKFFGDMLPEYDKERVYVSHMQKILNWYNILIEHNLVDLEKDAEEEAAEVVAGDVVETTDETEREKPAAKAKPADAGEADKESEENTDK